jgi:hypothetical protein
MALYGALLVIGAALFFCASSWADVPLLSSFQLALAFSIILASCIISLAYNQFVRLPRIKRDMRRAKAALPGEIEAPLAEVQPAPLATTLAVPLVIPLRERWQRLALPLALALLNGMLFSSR